MAYVARQVRGAIGARLGHENPGVLKVLARRFRVVIAVVLLETTHRPPIAVLYSLTLLRCCRVPAIRQPPSFGCCGCGSTCAGGGCGGCAVTSRVVSVALRRYCCAAMGRDRQRLSRAGGEWVPGDGAAGRRRLLRAVRGLVWRARPCGAAAVLLLLAPAAGCRMAAVEPARQQDSSTPPQPPSGATGELPELSIGDASLVDGTAGGGMRFEVRLAPASTSTVTVRYETEDGTAIAGLDYTAARGTLTFAAGTTRAAIEVAILSAAEGEEPKAFTVTLSTPSGARLAGAAGGGATATGTISKGSGTGGPNTGEPAGPGGPTGPTTTGDTDPPGLSALAVTGAGALYPAFAAGTRHYALTCTGSPTLTVDAATGRAGARLTLLRADRAAAVVSETGSLSASVTAVGGDHDLAIEVSDAGGSTTYVVHCLPDAFPTVSATGTGQAKAGLLLLTAAYGEFSNRVTFMTVLDNNGVPRFHRQLTTARFDDGQFWAMDFKYHGGARFSVSRRAQQSSSQSVFGDWQIDLLDNRLEVTTAGIGTAAPLTHTDAHDFHVTSGGDYVMLSYDDSTRDFTPYGGSATTSTRDSVIQRRTAAGVPQFTWNSWDHRTALQVGDDCRVGLYPDSYAHLNSLQVLSDGDYVASFRGCGQVLRIDGSSGAVEWKLGGTAPEADTNAEHLELVEHADPEVVEEFCGQHHVTLTSSDTVVMYDNGVQCNGPRKAMTPFSRAVEYDISSGTQAEYVREYRLPDAHGHFPYRGGVHVLEHFGGNVHWLISWGGAADNRTVDLDRTIAISEVDPSTGTAHLEVTMYKGARDAWSYRAYRVPESALDIPLNLP